MAATYKVFVDWNADGDFGDTGEDVTARTLDDRQKVTVSYGRDTFRTGSPISGGEAGLLLNNISRDYSPENGSSPLAGLVLPGRDVLIRATSGVTDYTLFRGALDDFDLDPAFEGRAISARCLDGLSRLKGTPVSTALHEAIRTGEALDVILDEVGWPADARDLDDGATVMPFWWLGEVDAFDAVMQLVDSEGQPSLVTISADGDFVFRDRHHRILLSASTSSQATWRSSGTEPLISEPAVYNHGWREIVNAVAYEVPVRQKSTSPEAVWTAPGRLSIAADETLTVTASAATAFADAVVPVEGTDYTATSGSVSIALSRTSGQSISIFVTAVGGAAVVDDLQLRARTVETVTTVRVTVEDTASIETYGRRAPNEERDPVWANRYDALAIGEILLGRRAHRLATLSVSMVGAGAPERLEQILTRDLSDRVHLVEEHSGFDGDCFVERIAHTISQGGLEHVGTFGVEAVPAEVATPFTFDLAGAGFDDGQFQVQGAISGTEVFRFDTSGQGFDDGRFGY
jgi:hypothetical protein